MDSSFYAYSKMGLTHIADLAAYDHILFIVALCAIYRLNEWKRVAILVTAFTIGHSVTLALAALNIITFKASVIELLIPVTIVLTCLYNIFSNSTQSFERGINPNAIRNRTQQLMVNYVFAFLFGLIHGMGFSNFFKVIADADENFIWMLFSFNVGLEVGQLMIVAVILVIAFVVMDILKVSQRLWTVLVSSVVGAMAIWLIVGLLGEG